MVWYSFLIECSVLTVVFCASRFRLFDAESEEESETPDYDPFIHLEQIGDKVYGHPRPSTGKFIRGFCCKLSDTFELNLFPHRSCCTYLKSKLVGKGTTWSVRLNPIPVNSVGIMKEFSTQRAFSELF